MEKTSLALPFGNVEERLLLCFLPNALINICMKTTSFLVTPKAPSARPKLGFIETSVLLYLGKVASGYAQSYNRTQIWAFAIPTWGVCLGEESWTDRER
ncbi:hypothetical protein BCON_0159g00260 [Botryotinia convoluta]|uniref:Uncharacterized protein n=1 Tax=Botryotinia convoluta TaxID=54673 RepID=A0A4Z1HR83_9HELO|nr:hypothetical protein BCON_0159g00260 [Botryotinia convoluta]